jgi:hypothetical protein
MTDLWRTRSKLVDGVWHIDVKNMQPPDPMTAILGLLESAAPAGDVIIHHDRDPIYLYPELHERGWQARRLDNPDDLVCLRLSRITAPS